MLPWEVIAICGQNSSKHTSTLSQQNEYFLAVTARGRYSYHCALKGSKEGYKRLPDKVRCCISKYLHNNL